MVSKEQKKNFLFKFIDKKKKRVKISAKKKKIATRLKGRLKLVQLYKCNFLDGGRILSVKDGVAKISGLLGVRAGEMVTLGLDRLPGMILSLEHNSVNAVIFGNDRALTQGQLAFRAFVIMSIPLSISLFGRVIDSLGNIIDGGKKISAVIQRKVDTKAVGIIPRQSVGEPLQTGIVCVDSITPIGCGQRECEKSKIIELFSKRKNTSAIANSHFRIHLKALWVKCKLDWVKRMNPKSGVLYGQGSVRSVSLELKHWSTSYGIKLQEKQSRHIRRSKVLLP